MRIFNFFFFFFKFNFPEETPVIDFKKELNYQKGKGKVLSKIQKEILKDVIALGNSSYLYDNTAYVVFGLEEKDGVFKSINDIKNQSVIFQQIAFLCRNYIGTGFNISHINVNIYELLTLVNSDKIRITMPLTTSHRDSACKENIMILQITREPKECLELKKDVIWLSKKGNKMIPKGKSWIRVGSHTFDILNDERRNLFVI